tara:strand:+ start:2513 stop:2854 length:342 start_codon:yes stop_codon:yes gene_type:complete
VKNNKTNYKCLNNLSNSLINKTILKKNKILSKKYIQDIISNIDTNGHYFHFLSKKFKLNFNNKIIKRFKKFDSVVIVVNCDDLLGQWKLLVKVLYFFFLNFLITAVDTKMKSV